MPTRTFESKTIFKLDENEIMKCYKLGFEIEWTSVSYSLFQSQKVQNMSYPAEISLKSYKTSRKRRVFFSLNTIHAETGKCVETP